MSMDLKDKVAVVTGATRGIGYSMAEGLLAEGAKVFLCGRDASMLSAAIARLDKSASGRVDGVAANVSRFEDCHKLIHGAAERFGGIDILVNNAGRDLFKPAAEFTPEEWDSIIGTNLSGAFYCCREAIPLMRQRGGGYIFNISSLSTTVPHAGGSAYNASKSGLNSLTDALMHDYRHDNIRVTCLMPGSVDTSDTYPSGSKPPEPWKLHGADVARAIVELYKFAPKALASRIDLRPLQPPRKS